MASTDLALLEKRLRLRYETARLKLAVLGLIPALLASALAAWLGGDPAFAALLGAVIFVWGALLLWYGRDPGRAVLPGLAAGLVPLTFALCSQLMPHGCAADHCFSTCVPACAAGGLISGLVVAAVGLRGRHGAVFWLSASGLSLLTGAMGCACVGYPGVIGMVLGYGAGLALSAISKLRA